MQIDGFVFLPFGPRFQFSLDTRWTYIDSVFFDLFPHSFKTVLRVERVGLVWRKYVDPTVCQIQLSFISEVDDGRQRVHQLGHESNAQFLTSFLLWRIWRLWGQLWVRHEIEGRKREGGERKGNGGKRHFTFSLQLCQLHGHSQTEAVLVNDWKSLFSCGHTTI